MLKKIALGSVLLIVLFVLYSIAVGMGWLGRLEHAGLPSAPKVTLNELSQRLSAQRAAEAAFKTASTNKQILFGDFHVHSTFSFDAFTMSLPISQGDEGPHTPADACDYARYCSALDFWSINDHAEQLSPRMWQETVDVVRECNALAGPSDNPDLVTFLGWEWTQTGPTAAQHFGHKNVIIKGIDETDIPTRPIAAPTQGAPLPPFAVRGLLTLASGDQRTLDMMPYLSDVESTALCEPGTPVRELSSQCREIAATPNELFAKLDDWKLDSIVIPHGTTWGIYTPPLADWRKQLESAHDPSRQTLVEVYSGHGNSERWIDNQAWQVDSTGNKLCPSETNSYLPGCRQAGRIIHNRCLLEGESRDECERRANTAQLNFVNADMAGHMTVPGVDMWKDWLDSAQCRDCFLSTFNYRRRGSVQYMLAMSDFTEPNVIKRFNFGFIGSSDNHSAKPGTGYKEIDFTKNTDARFFLKSLSNFVRTQSEPVAHSNALSWQDVSKDSLAEAERFNSFWYTGGLVAVHAQGRDREAIWSALKRRETYATSGPRTLLWFDLLSEESKHPMGSTLSRSNNPNFRVRAVGSRKQREGCPSSAIDAVGEQRLAQLCNNECYFPSDERRLIERIEIVRIRPQQFASEAIDPLIENAWRVFQCEPNQNGCEVSFSDPDFAQQARDAVYYARAIEAAQPTINAANLGCEYNSDGVCITMRDCGNDPTTPNDCLAPAEHRAWSSPIFVNFNDS